jgi:hypothetical protein
MSDHGDDGADFPATKGPKLKSDPNPAALISRGPTSEIILNWAGFFVGLLIMTGDYVVAGRTLKREAWEFIASPKAMVWIFLVAGQFAFWANLIEPLWRWRSKLRLDYGLSQTHAIRLKLMAAIVFFALPGFFLVYVVPDSNLAHHDEKMGLVNVAAMITALVAVAGIWYVRAAVVATFAENGSAVRQSIPVQKQIEIVIDLRTHLQRYITVLGAMVALATLAKGALRQAILATGGKSADFPAEYVLLQGAYFTALLALVYIPTYSILAEVGSDLVETIYPITKGDLDWDHLSRWQGNRKGLEGLLQLEGGAVHNLRASVSILAPVATSVMSVLLGAK